MKKILSYLLISLLVLVVSVVSYLLIKFPPIMAGVAAKTMCSCVFVMGRSTESVIQKELAVFPGLSSAEITFQDSLSVSASILGSTRKAIFRKGIGCTLLAERAEEEVLRQPITLAKPIQTDSLPWPTGNQVPETKIDGVDYIRISEAIDEAFVESNPEEPKNTLAVVVVYDGQLIGEKYAPGINYNSPLLGWSMTKSITNAMVGLLVLDGRLRLDQPAPVPEWANDKRKHITINNLMQASSGLAWDETYNFPGDFHNMFIFSDDKGGYAANKELQYPIGTHFEYSSGTTNLLAKIVRQTVGDSLYYRFAPERLFQKIGMSHTLIEPDASGTYVGSSYGFASARDWARFGLLFLNDGVWNGERILPEGWSTYSSTPAPAATLGEYGAQWWLNAGAKAHPEHCHNPGLPHDEYGAEGFEEQNLWIFPSKKLIVVRLGISHHGFDNIGLAQKILGALPE